MISLRKSIALHNSIATRIFRIAFLLYLLVAIMATCYHMVLEYRNSQDSVQQEFRTLESMYKRSLSNAVWNDDKPHLRFLAQNVLKSPAIQGIQIFGQDERLLMEIGISITGETPNLSHPKRESWLFSSYLDQVFQYEFPATHESKQGPLVIGKVVFYSSNQVINEKVSHAFGLIAFIGLIKAFALLVIYQVVLKLWLSRPLSWLTEAVQKVDPDNLEQEAIDSHLSGQNELTILQDAFNSLLKRLHDSQKALLSLNRDLEQKVKDRTQELQHALKTAEEFNKEINNSMKLLRKVNSTLNLEEIALYAMRVLLEVVEFNQMGIFLIDQERKILHLEHYFGQGLETETLEALRNIHIQLQPDSSILADCCLENELVYYPDLLYLPKEKFHQTDQRFYRTNPIRGVVLIPVQIQQSPIGLIMICNTLAPFDLNEASIQRIQRYVTQIATAILHAQLHEEGRRKQQEIEKAHTEIQSQKERLEDLAHNLTKYLPHHVIHSIFTGQHKASVKTFRKKLSVFFSDIEGFTEFTDTTDPETLEQVLNEYFNTMSGIARKHEGNLDKIMGDAILIFFGDPESRGDKQDAIACVRMALEMQAAMRALRHKWKQQGLVNPIQTRMGIHTGFCTVGNFGSDDRLYYTIIGSTVNLANRIEGAAASNQIYISQETRALIQDEFATEPKGELKFKGIAYPVQVYRVLHPTEHARAMSSSYKQSGEAWSIEFDPQTISTQERLKLQMLVEETMKRLQSRLSSSPTLRQQPETAGKRHGDGE